MMRLAGLLRTSGGVALGLIMTAWSAPQAAAQAERMMVDPDQIESREAGQNRRSHARQATAGDAGARPEDVQFRRAARQQRADRAERQAQAADMREARQAARVEPSFDPVVAQREAVVAGPAEPDVRVQRGGNERAAARAREQIRRDRMAHRGAGPLPEDWHGRRTEQNENSREWREDRREAREDRRELREDRRESTRETSGDQRDARRENRREWREDRRDERRDERRDWRKDRREDRQDWRDERREDRREWRGERRREAAREDRREWRQDRHDYRENRRDYREAQRDYREQRRWDRRAWRNDRRYDWHRHRYANRSVFRLGAYYSPYRNYSYRRFGIGTRISSLFFGSRYWISDPWRYRLPAVYGPYRWVRYYDDVLLVDTYSGDVVDVIYDFFW